MRLTRYGRTPMSRRIEIELTSARPDGTWTWRAAGAREPKGVMTAEVPPSGSKVGDLLKVDAEFDIEGITILGVAGTSRSRKQPSLLEFIPSARPFEPVIETKIPRSDRPRGDRNDRGDRPDRPRSDRPGGPRRDGDRPPRPEGDRSPRPGSADRGQRPDGGRGPGRPAGERTSGDRPQRPQRPRFEAVPELPQRPRPKRLKAGRAHRNAALAALPDAQRPIAEKALQGGIAGVRQAVNDQNAELRAAGQAEVPAAGLLKMAEDIMPRLRLAEWLDRADAAKADIADLDLRDLRSVVAAGEDPAVAREESTRAILAELKAALTEKQEQAYNEWTEDIASALGVGRSIRALKLSSEPPKAGVRFPVELGQNLINATMASLTADAAAERWSAVLEALAFSPIRLQVVPAAAPTAMTDELKKTVTRLAPLLPAIATLFGVEATGTGHAPKPLRPARRPEPGKPAAGGTPKPGGQKAPAKAGELRPPPPPRPAADSSPAKTIRDAAAKAAPDNEAAEVTEVTEAPAVVAEVVETPDVAEAPPVPEAQVAAEADVAAEAEPVAEATPAAVETSDVAADATPVAEDGPPAKTGTDAAPEATPLTEAGPPAETGTDAAPAAE